MTERGVSESLQWAILTPLILLVLLGTIQAGIWLHGRTVIYNAAVLAAEEAARMHPSVDPETSASDFAERGGIREVSVEVASTQTEVRVAATGRVILFFDVGQSLVTAEVVRPRERVSVP